MGTLGTLKTDIDNELSRGGSIDSEIAKAIDSAIAYYETKRFWFLEGETTDTTADGTPNYDLPSDFQSMVLLTVTASGDRRTLSEKPYAWYRAIVWDTATAKGEPVWFSIWDDDIWLYPTPDDAYTLTYSYIKSLGAPATDGASNAWTTDAEALIRASAKRRLLTDVIRDYEEAQAQTQVERDELTRLLSYSVKRVGTGRVRPRYW